LIAVFVAPLFVVHTVGVSTALAIRVVSE